MPNSDAFVWYELMTTDMNAAEAFYGAVIGWGRQAWGEPGTPYTLMSASRTAGAIARGSPGSCAP